MDDAHIASLLAPFISSPGLNALQMEQVRAYLDVLLKWNEKTNLTAVRKPEEIISRHFGESFFLASSLQQIHVPGAATVDGKFIDVGSGAGFPGIPLKIYSPQRKGALIESQDKKATFLKEVIRTLKLTDIAVLRGRAEALAQTAAGHAGLVTLRAVERFESVLPVAARLVAPNGLLALLIGSAQLETAYKLLPSFAWDPPRPLPLSQARVLLVGKN
jgi:16S rRNA (guanine527-N7)-methyltransferase